MVYIVCRMMGFKEISRLILFFKQEPIFLLQKKQQKHKLSIMYDNLFYLILIFVYKFKIIIKRF